VAHPDPERLAAVPLFAGLTGDERTRVASWLDVEEFAAGRMLTREGRADYAFFVLDEGRVHVEREGAVVNVLEPGDVFGEMSFFDPTGRRNADIVPDTDVRVFSMFGTRFREMQLSIPDVASRLEQLVAERATDRPN
jgi:CRP-like cAMP-binding protein